MNHFFLILYQSANSCSLKYKKAKLNRWNELVFSCWIQHWGHPLQSWLEMWKSLTIINRNGYCLNEGLATTLQSTSHKIMQITFFSDGPAFFSSLLLLYCHNCSVLRKLSCMFSTALFFSWEPQQSGREKKSPAMLVVWDYADNIMLNVLNESLMLPTVTFLRNIHHNIFLTL